MVSWLETVHLSGESEKPDFTKWVLADNNNVQRILALCSSHGKTLEREKERETETSESQGK